MRFFIIALCAMGLSAAAKAQTPAATATATKSSASPAENLSTTTADNTRYLANPRLLTACTGRLAAFTDKPCDIIFIGDSSTAGWLGVGLPVWDKTYAPRHALNFGIAGDTIQNVLWRLSNMDVQSIKPKVAVILIGAENVAANAHEIADGVKAVVANTQESFPGVKIILVSILPNTVTVDKTTRANALLKTLADDSSVYYLDLASLMPPVTNTRPDGTVDSNWKGLGSDHLNPDITGYQIWADAMEPLLKQLLPGTN
jgi:lysophospholipase L1-like esterase